jgi:hypothetical protein
MGLPFLMIKVLQTIDKQLVTVGAPFHFYFGLKRGASSFDRFKGKWINTEIIVN